MNLMPISVRAHLRAATAELHEALHRAAPFAALAEGHATRAGYGAMLRLLHRYHTAMAPLCARGAVALHAPQLAAAHRARLSALELDLAHLGEAPSRGPLIVERGAPDFCAGVLYTVQGSTLGGKLLFRQAAHLLPGPDGRRFFAGTPEDGRHWQALCAGLDSCCGDPAELEAGARHGFARFADMLGG